MGSSVPPEIPLDPPLLFDVVLCVLSRSGVILPIKREMYALVFIRL